MLAPLDWGLGHATRCIPLIDRLLKDGHEVYLAGDGRIKTLLLQEFPNLHFLSLKGYDVYYARTKKGLLFTMLQQVPKILKAIRYEHHWLDDAMKKYHFDMVISDNRYGLYHPDAYSIFITHQLLIRAPYRWMEQMLQRINYRLINKFDECWVPDQEQPPYLAGELAHPSLLPRIRVKYIGPLSRFHHDNSIEAGQHLLILLSGPEPQRSILEQNILSQLEGIVGNVLMVRGVPGEDRIPVAAPHVVIKNHLPADQMKDALLQASMVISRCGYSTVMDLMAVRKKSILIPTPGQTEQEYLARHLMEQHLALCIPQDTFNLQAALSLASSFPYQTCVFDWDQDKFENIIGDMGRINDSN
ncbi:glycosyl transferase family 28 [Chitinophagaceae bacterium LB-8]|uniref:Glycosyl transferase family 28 n=1 Tax=Paraflavisolibacter caeni TaxID=2982496 RepID=A0A9X2XXT5_9BACT|nr:glycosyltransferase [Paraflavisolibacter caeni]MCU7550726.1 glycosyl transferase family 28 [Paraflavisolibacter caeni]